MEEEFLSSLHTEDKKTVDEVGMEEELMLLVDLYTKNLGMAPSVEDNYNP